MKIIKIDIKLEQKDNFLFEQIDFLLICTKGKYAPIRYSKLKTRSLSLDDRHLPVPLSFEKSLPRVLCIR